VEAKPAVAELGRPMAHLMEHIQNLLRHQSARVLDTFRKWDKDGSKVLDYPEFEKAMSALGVANPAEVSTLWNQFDTDNSSDVSYHELLSILQPSLAKANPSLAAMDPTNKQERWSYNRKDQEEASGRLERNTTRDVPYAHQRRMDSGAVHAHFSGSLRNMDVDPNAKWDPNEKAVSKLPGMKLDATKGESGAEQLQDAMTKMATARVIDVFRGWDTDESGHISYREFSTALVALGLDAQSSVGEIKEMFDEFDKNNDGDITYDELKALLQPRGKKKRKSTASKKPTGGLVGVPPAELKRRKEAAAKQRTQKRPGKEPDADDGDDADEGEESGPPALIERVKQKMLGKMDRVLDTFKKYDRDNSKTISKSEFEKAMHTLGFAGEDTDKIWGSFDQDGSGEVVYHELLAVLQPQMVKKGGHAAGASDPNNTQKRWSYTKNESESAHKLIERSGRPDTTYEEMEDIRRRQRNPEFVAGRGNRTSASHAQF